MRGAVSALAAVLAFACVFALDVGAADAATFDVTTTDDEVDPGPPTPCDPGDTDCSLREAIIAANATGGLDTVRIPAGTYKITIPKGDGLADNGDFDITNDLTIERSGAGAVVIDGEAVDNVFEISPTATDVTVSDVSVIDGNRNQASGSSANFVEHGGGFRTLGQLTLNRVVVDDNTAFGQGGGIAVLSAGSLTATDTTITGNLAASGGGIFHAATGTVSLNGSTVRANETTASGQGGGIAAVNAGALTIERSEISENIAGTHGGITVSSTPLTLRSSTVSGNRAQSTSFSGSGGISVGGGPFRPRSSSRTRRSRTTSGMPPPSPTMSQGTSAYRAAATP